MKTDFTPEKLVTRSNMVWFKIGPMSQEREGGENFEEHRERIREIIDEDREILDELA